MECRATPLILSVGIGSGLKELTGQIRLVMVGHAVQGRAPVEAHHGDVGSSGKELPHDGPVLAGDSPVQSREFHGTDGIQKLRILFQGPSDPVLIPLSGGRHELCGAQSVLVWSKLQSLEGPALIGDDHPTR
jgi:hypothetical protein